MTNFFVYFLSLLICFSNYGNYYESETVLFKKFLKKSFNKEIPYETQYYFVINLNNCQSCVNSSINSVNKISSNKALKNMICIACYKSKVPPKKINTIKFKNIYKDKGAYFFSLDISPDYDTIIKTSQNKIVAIYELNDENLNEIF